MYKAIVLLLIIVCSSCSTYRQTEGVLAQGYGFDEPVGSITQSLFEDESSMITEENIQKILDGDYALPNNLRTSIINLKKNEGRFYWSNEEYLKSQQTYLDLFKNKFTSSDRITQVKAIPDLLLSDQLTFTNIREAAVRTQSDIVIVYSIDSDLYSKYKLFTKNDIKAYATMQLIILDIRTGLIPFLTIVTKEFLSQKQEGDFNETEAANRVKNQAVLLTIEEIGQQIADFLKDEIN